MEAPTFETSDLTILCNNSSFAISCLKDWNKFGKANFIQHSKDDIDTCFDNLSDLFIRLVLGDGKVDFLQSLLTDLSKIFSKNQFASRLADVLWLIDASMTDITDSRAKERYISLVTLCKTVIDPSLLMERLSDDTLEQISVIESRQHFQTRYIRTKTRLFFKQQKFNLLREESEGYAKLIVELSQPVGPVEQCITHVRSLIGYFDLDPNRVLDIILDACEIRTDMFDIFIDLIILYHPDKVDLTHILGHKFHFYEGQEALTPESLHKLAAHLITKKMIDVDVLLSHLQPSDDVIHSGRLRKLREAKDYKPPTKSSLGFSDLPSSTTVLGSLDNMIVGSSNFSSNPGSSSSLLDEPNRQHVAGCQGDSELSGKPIPPDLLGQNNERFTPMMTDISEQKDRNLAEDEIGEFQFSNNQKLDLCAALARSGDWRSAQKILDRFPGHWIGSHSNLNKSVCELIHFLIEPLYASTFPLPSCLMKSRKRPKTPALFSASMQSESKQLLDVQPASDFQSLGRCVLPITGYLGPFLCDDIVLIVKLCRLCGLYLSMPVSPDTSQDPVYQAIFNMTDESILPSLSMVPANCCLAEEIWRLLRHFPYHHRYRLYGQWNHISYQGEPALIRKRAVLLARTKAIMKRLSKENVKQLGRHLGKLSHSSPGVLFDFVLQSIQMFTNLIGPVVDSLKYVSSLGYDVLAFSLIEALAADKSKLDDLQLGQCLQALSNFTGLLCKKYQFDLSGILQYVLNQLKVGKSYDLLILREIIHQMSGVDTSEEMTEEQLEAASGGELLLQEGGYYAQIRNARKNATRLKDALIEHKMVMPFVFLMAQQRDAILYIDNPDRHVKLAGRLYDQSQGTLVQFITFLSLQLTREEMQAQLLPIHEMMGEYYVPADTAFCLFRCMFGQCVDKVFEASLEKLPETEKQISTVSSTKACYVNACRQVISEIGQAISPLFSPRIWDELGASFFATFWCLDSGDLLVPDAAYLRQQSQLRLQLNQIDMNSDWTSAKKKRETERFQSLINRLSREHTTRQVHVDRIHAWLLSERDNWFQTMSATKTDTITQFLQYCVYPRACFTASDAIYAAQFIHVLHQLKAARFSTLICLDRVFNDITLPISMCTEDEAHRYGRFLCSMLDLVMRWHASEDNFNQECGQFPGFVTVFRKGSEASTKADQLQYENYRHVVHKWHYRITKATVACLESGTYSRIRNALIVLTRILPHYPKITQFGSAVERRVNKLKEEEKDKRPDLKALAFSYAGLMRPRKTAWVCEEEFHTVEQKRSGVVAGSEAPANSRISPSTLPDVTQKLPAPDINKLGAMTLHRSSKPYSGSNIIASQKRSAITPSLGQTVAVERVGLSAEEIHEAKYRRSMGNEGTHAISATKANMSMEDSKEVRRLMRKRSAVTASLVPPDGDQVVSLSRSSAVNLSINLPSTSLNSLRVPSAHTERTVAMETSRELIVDCNDEVINSMNTPNGSAAKKSRKGPYRTFGSSERPDHDKRHRRSSNSAHHHRSRRSADSSLSPSDTISPARAPSVGQTSLAATSVAFSRHARK